MIIYSKIISNVLYFYFSVCTDQFDASWANNLVVAESSTNQLPAKYGDEITLKCEDGYEQKGSDTITCQDGTQFTFSTQPNCEKLGKKSSKICSMCSTSITEPIFFQFVTDWLTTQYSQHELHRINCSLLIVVLSSL